MKATLLFAAAFAFAANAALAQTTPSTTPQPGSSTNMPSTTTPQSGTMNNGTMNDRMNNGSTMSNGTMNNGTMSDKGSMRGNRRMKKDGKMKSSTNGAMKSTM